VRGGAPPRLYTGTVVPVTVQRHGSGSVQRLRRLAAAVCVSTLVLGAGVAHAQEAGQPAFSDWLAGVRAEALARGIRQETVDAALATVDEPQTAVIERDRSQAESVLSLDAYVARQLTPKVIRMARAAYAEHRELLDDVGARYGVPPPLIVGIWGIESRFGQFSGVRPTIAALATLAWDRRRAALFREELFDALTILDDGDVNLDKMRGSWAGAMGQAQFVPSSYLKWAVDFDGDGRRDIWSSPADVFASIANYLRGNGWTTGERWGREVKVSRAAARRIASTVAQRDGSCQARRNMSVALPLAQWQQLGVRLPSGRALPTSDLAASLVSGERRHFLVYRNYDVLLDYNCAHAYAVTVGLLADSIPATGQARSRRAGVR
jgi:membrane-bound lytic murein transglycosylase B